MTNVQLCSMKDCNEARAVSRNGRNYSYCRNHKNEYDRNWYATHPGAKAEQNSRYFASREGHVYLDVNDGYEKRMGFNHPAASPSGLTRYHRVVLWDKLGGNNAPCDECSRPLFWDTTQISNPLDALQVDHVDGVRNNNDPSNLVPICSPCNTKRAKARNGGVAA